MGIPLIQSRTDSDMLLRFRRDGDVKPNPDFWERLGNFNLCLLHIKSGTTVIVKRIPDSPDNLSFTESQRSTCAKVVAFALMIILFPVMLPMVMIGYASFERSESRRKILDLYKKNICKNSPQPLDPKLPKNESKDIQLLKDAQRDVAARIQNFFRTKNESKNIQRLKDAQRDVAARKIQNCFRKNLAKKIALPQKLYFRCIPLCDKLIKKAISMPVACSRCTPVYKPKEVPEVVLKAFTTDKALAERILNIVKVKDILKSQRSSHLTVANATKYKNFLVEDRIPINENRYYNMALYTSEPEMFTLAVRELVRLFSKLCIDDLITWTAGEEFSSVRYDNIAMYAVEEDGIKLGKIGLIDLGQIRKPARGGRDRNCLETLAKIFPYHLDAIKEEASVQELSFDADDLDDWAKYGKARIKKQFTDRLDWLEEKGITDTSQQHSIEFSDERQAALTDLVTKELLVLNQGHNGLFSRKGYLTEPEKDFFKENPAEQAKKLAEVITPLIINHIQYQINCTYNTAKEATPELTLPKSELLRLRSPVLNLLECYQKAETQISSSIEHTDLQTPQDIALQLTYCIMEALVAGKEIHTFKEYPFKGQCVVVHY